MPRTSWDLLKLGYVVVPPLDEQWAIVAYLDTETAKIDTLIAKKERLVALLAERRAALIARCVTGGLDPTAPTKPSGVAWLGDIPAHWQVMQIGHFARVGNGSTPARENDAYWLDGIYPWLNSASVHEGEITHADQFVTDAALRECHLPRVAPGSILVAITGQGKTRGTAAILRIEATINQHIAFLTVKSGGPMIEFLHATLCAAYSDLRRMSEEAGSTKGALTCEDFRHYRVPVPPLSEQRAIAAYLDTETAKLDALMEKTRRHIALLGERRTALIAAAVTGRIAVPAVVPALPVDTPLDA
ncbi:MAG: restriction endonuclease subunit S [Thermomicrobiales bacterium]